MNAAFPRILIVSACDQRFMPLLADMIASIAPALSSGRCQMACFDIGLSADNRRWLGQQSIVTAVPHAHFGLEVQDHAPALLSFLARPFLREYFPGYDVYFWIDSDVWLQDIAVLDRYIGGALETGFAITHESDAGYRLQAWLLGWTAKHFLLGYGPLAAAHLLSRRHLNAGMFAAAANAPQWDQWARCYDAAIRRSGALVPHDQFALNQALYRRAAGHHGQPNARLLEPSNNWICDRGVPMWNDAAGAFCKPYAPFDVIGALHLAGPAKRTRYSIRRTHGGTFDSFILRGASPERPGQPVLLDVAPAQAVAA